MKFNFKKISAIAAGALMVGMTVGVAAAASFPSPYSSSTGSGVAVVTGTGTGVDDTVAASSITNYLATQVRTTGTSVSGGDSYKFEKTSTKFHLGDTITAVISSSIDDDELPSLLADGEYVDDDNDEFDFTQKIDMGTTVQLGMFEDNDYAEDEPTIGFKIASGANVLNYTLDFSDEPLKSDIVGTNMVIMGRTYYVLSNGSSSAGLILTLLDSAESTVITEEETSTITVNGNSYEVTIEFISGSEVKLNVNGETTNSLEELQTQKISDGAFVGIRDIMYSSKTGTLGKVEVSIGSGKLKLTNASDIELNDDSISDLSVIITNTSTKLSSIKIIWNAEDDLFITEDREETMPGFKAVKLSFGGLTYPAEEVIEVKQGGDLYAVLENFPLKDSTEDINFLYATDSGTFLGVGKDADNQLITSSTNSLSFDKDTDDWFVVSWSDGSDAESYLMRATNFVVDSTVNKTDFQYRKNGVWTDKKTSAEASDTFSMGQADLIVGAIDRADKTVGISTTSGNVNFHELYSKEGLTVYLPYNSTRNGNVTTYLDGEMFFPGTTNASLAEGHNSSSFYVMMKEEDKNGNKAGSSGSAGVNWDWLRATIGWDGSSTAEVEVSAVTTVNNTDGGGTGEEILDTDVWRDFTYSALATEILYDKPSGGQKSVKFIYHGDEVAADVYINAPETSIGTSAEAGSMVFTDAEKTSWQGRDVVLVGGSCINSATATALGVAYPTCEAAFTAATGIGSGQYLIQSVGDAFTTGKIALVVAGYEKADTAAAASRLVNLPSTIDTTAGGKYMGIVGVEGTSTISKII